MTRPEEFQLPIPNYQSLIIVNSSTKIRDDESCPYITNYLAKKRIR